jgi:hypothetical protein
MLAGDRKMNKIAHKLAEMNAKEAALDAASIMASLVDQGAIPTEKAYHDDGATKTAASMGKITAPLKTYVSRLTGSNLKQVQSRYQNSLRRLSVIGNAIYYKLRTDPSLSSDKYFSLEQLSDKIGLARKNRYAGLCRDTAKAIAESRKARLYTAGGVGIAGLGGLGIASLKSKERNPEETQ